MALLLAEFMLHRMPEATHRGVVVGMQAQASYESTTKASVPEEMQKAELEVKAARQQSAAQQKVYESRQQLYQQGALPRKELDQAEVNYIQARNQ